jgi:hypothetical protein
MRKEAHEYWYVFPCQNKPIQISKWSNPLEPFKKFNTYDDALAYIKAREKAK